MELLSRLLAGRPSSLDLSPRAAVALLALAALIAAAAWRAPDAFRNADAAARGGAASSKADRLLAGAHSTDVDTRVLVTARELIPPAATYAVVTGPNAHVSHQVTLDAIRPFALYWLLPRRQTPEPSQADWILSYGGDLEQLGLSYARVIEITPGIQLAQVKR